MRAAFSLFLLLLCTFISHAQETLTPKQAKAKFEKADKALNEAWAAVKAALSEVDFNKLKESQRAWMSYRDALARSPQYTGVASVDELPLDSPDYLAAAVALTEIRTEWLEALASAHLDEGDSLTGVWSDSFGGSMEVVESDGKLYFNIACVRGLTSHMGFLSGVADWNQTIGWFSDKGQQSDKEEVTNLSFIMRDRQLEIIGANTKPYHGVRAYFDGSYVKTGPLDAGQKAKLIKAAKDGAMVEE